MTVSPARRAALRALGRIRSRGAFAAPALDAVMEGSSLSDADTALATRLTYGTLQTSGTLDEVIDRFAARPGDLEPQVRDALRMGAYELLFMRTPDWAAVNEAVASVRAARPQAAGLANAVLRRVADAASEFPWGDPAHDEVALARATGHPAWMAGLLIEDLGLETARRVMTDGNEPAPLYLWHNPFRGDVEAVMRLLEEDGADPAPSVPAGCIVAGRPSAAVGGKAVSGALAVVTDAAAQLAARALRAQPGDVVVELAAGRGTKTAQIQAHAIAAGGPADIRAVDVHAFKANVMRERMAELGVPGVRVLTGDATDLATVGGLPQPGGADAVLLDAPCSGLGTLRRHPEARWRLRADDVARLALLQATLLAQAATLVRPGGVVVYSTCSLARRENHDVVSGFLGEGPGSLFRTSSAADVVPPEWSGWVGSEGWFQSLPLAGGPDGHFVAVLERAG